MSVRIYKDYSIEIIKSQLTVEGVPNPEEYKVSISSKRNMDINNYGSGILESFTLDREQAEEVIKLLRDKLDSK